MTDGNSTAPAPQRKPQNKHRKRKPGKRHPGEPKKPYKGFPLFTVASGNGAGRWAKKIRGRLFYFGPWDDPDGALQRYLDQKDDLHAGRVPRARGGDAGPTLRDLCNRFMTTKTGLRDTGELSIHSWNDYFRVCECLVQTFGRDRLLTDLLPEDFERLRMLWAAKWGPVRLGNEINRARVVFNYGYKNGLLDRPMRYGEGFKRPSRKTLRIARAEQGPQMFEAGELGRILRAATQPMKAMILLGVNCGFGNNDVAMLTMTALDLKAGWLTYPRPKTGIMRRVPLWPETIKALRDWLKIRPEPCKPEDAGLVFITSKGGSWGKETTDNPVSKEKRKLLDRLGINGHRNFYCLRRTFETIAGESRDQVAVDAIMGHVDSSMAATYRQRISDERLVAVTEHVRHWLFGTIKPGKTAAPRLKIAAEPKGDAAASA